METTFSFSKSDPAAALVSKCMAAIAKQDYSNCTRDDFADAADAIAKSIAAEHHVNFTDAYCALMAGPEGKALYAASAECPAVGTGPVVKCEEVSKSEQLEREAQRFSEVYKVDLREARRLVSEYYR